MTTPLEQERLAKRYPSMAQERAAPRVGRGASVEDVRFAKKYPTMTTQAQPAPRPNAQVEAELDRLQDRYPSLNVRQAAPSRATPQDGGDADDEDEPEPATQEALVFGDDALAASTEEVEEVPVTIDQAHPFFEEFTTVALDEEDQGKLLALHRREVERVEAARRDSWHREVQADREVQAAAPALRQLLKTYGSPKLAAVLDETGLGSHPELVKFLARIARDRR